MSSQPDIPFIIEPEPVPGVTQGWIVIHGGGPGSACAVPVAMIVDPDGETHYVPMGDGQPVTIVDDTAAPA